MANQRIKDIANTATSTASDDYLVIDGATNGTRKIQVSSVGGGIDFQTSLTPSIDARGVNYAVYKITPTTAMTSTEFAEFAPKMTAYLNDGLQIYPLIVVNVSFQTTYLLIYCKSIYTSVQSTSTSSINGTLHIVAPFEIDSVTGWM